VSNGSQREDKKLLKCSQLCHQGEYQHIIKHQYMMAIQWCGYT